MKHKKLVITLSVVFMLAIAGLAVYFLAFHNTEKPMIEIKGYYDANGNLISEQTQSVVGGVAGVKYIKLGINVLNKDEVPLNLKIIDATPLDFKTSLPTDEKEAGKGAYASWTSNLLDITTYEGNIQAFCVTIQGSSALRTSASKTSCINISVEKDPATNFEIQLTSENQDTPTIPPNNTIPPVNPNTYVYFRTMDLSYGTTNAVAYASNCGNSLIAYGRTSGSCTNHLCNSLAQINLPNNAVMWVGSDVSASDLCICDSTIVNTNTYSKRYSTSDSDASKAILTTNSTNTAYELSCTK